MENEEALERLPGRVSGSSIYIYLLLAAILALGFYVTVVRPFNRPDINTAPQARITKGSSADGEIFLNYPATWSQLTEGELAKYNGAFVLAIERTNPRVFLSVKTQTINAANVKLEELAGSLDRQILKTFTDAKKLSHDVITLSGKRQALRYEYSFQSASKAKVREQLVIMPADSKVYHISASAREEDFESVRGELNSMIQSFEIK